MLSPSNRPEALAPCSKSIGESVIKVGATKGCKIIECGLTPFDEDLCPSLIAERGGIAFHNGLRTEARAQASPSRREVGDDAYVERLPEKETPASPQTNVKGDDVEPRSRMQLSPGYLNSFETVISALKNGGKQAQDAGHIAHGACLLHASVELEVILAERTSPQSRNNALDRAKSLTNINEHRGNEYLTGSGTTVNLQGEAPLPHMATRLVIVESPFAGDVEANIAYARAALRDCLDRGEAPYASHLLYTQPGVLDDNDADQRRHSIEAGLSWGKMAGATVVYTDRGISTGMQQGIDRAKAEGRAIEYRSIEKAAAE